MEEILKVNNNNNNKNMDKCRETLPELSPFSQTGKLVLL